MNQLSTWIETAIENGATVSMRALSDRGKLAYSAMAVWPRLNNEQIMGTTEPTPAKALDSLDLAIMEDAADEMAKQGKA